MVTEDEQMSRGIMKLVNYRLRLAYGKRLIKLNQEIKNKITIDIHNEQVIR
ncbi:hypothetical protein [Bacillus atrophaeus]|uniref:hypothetical protein n=1 Tax=Bacillus atrophaeus TaxID=1452 RepID=UPI00227F042F|nr:hypothetical protein [Bacillus atrophaeus]MCY8837569.1 hypothetical protein [Bacillus atrophaeus]